MKVKNFKAFLEWYERVYDGDITVLPDEYFINEVFQQWCETGRTEFELRGCETKSRHPECYDFDIELVELDGECSEIVIVF